MSPSKTKAPPESGSAPKKAGAPPWRSAVNRVDRLVTPKADAFVRTHLFAHVLAGGAGMGVQGPRRAERQTSAVLHLVNLPTAGDVRRVRAQLATVEAR